MKDTSTHITVQFLTEVYVTYRPLVLRYITGKLNGCLEAEDLVQDAFFTFYWNTVLCFALRQFVLFLYTIVRNLVTDYLRRHYKKQEVIACMQERLSASVVDTESQIIVKDICRQELFVLQQLPFKTRAVYYKSRFDEKSALEIAIDLDIPKRTVEGYLLKGRKVVREYIKQCI